MNPRRVTVPPGVAEAVARLRAAGYAAYPVGGCVRDSLLGLTPGDWDLCTAARPEQVTACFPDVRVLPTGLKHGTVTLVWAGRVMEITTFRSDGDYGDHRRPEQVTFVGSLREDQSRRDFTINAMAVDLDGTVLDAFGGQADLASGLVRCVGDPRQRFSEDALRILRALRFAARLGFQVEAETDAALRADRALLLGLSGERIYAELKGILAGRDAGRVLADYPELFYTLFPALATADWPALARSVGAAPLDPLGRLALLLAPLGPQGAEAALRRLKSDAAARRAVALLAARLPESPPEDRRQALRLAADLGREQAGRLCRLWESQGKNSDMLAGVLAEQVCLTVRELAVGGDDLIRLGAAEGKAVGALLVRLLDAVWDGKCPNEPGPLRELAAALLTRAVTDSAGAIVLRRGAGGTEVLMIRNRFGWSFPKGHLQPGEAAEAAALREVREETGIRAALLPGFRRETVSPLAGERRRVIFFLGRYLGGALRPQRSEVRDAAWFPVQEAAAGIGLADDREIWLAGLAFARDHGELSE